MHGVPCTHSSARINARSTRAASVGFLFKIWATVSGLETSWLGFREFQNELICMTLDRRIEGSRGMRVG